MLACVELDESVMVFAFHVFLLSLRLIFRFTGLSDLPDFGKSGGG